MFIGIDHGTTAMRFSSGDAEFKISREKARDFSVDDLACLVPLDEIEGIAVCYSMGDGISAVTDIRKVLNRGVVSREGAGKHIGGGTRVYDAIRESGLPAIVIPGLHRGSPTDPRFKAYSHQASPEKIGILYEVVHTLGGDVVVCDVSSNTVTLLVTGGRITGAFDACLFAPGTRHGALDVDAIRRIDRGESTANEAFLHAGVSSTVAPALQVETLAMFSAMECASMLLLNPCANVALAGTMAPATAPQVEELLSRSVTVYDEWCAARGLARIAHDVFSGATGILGLSIER
ncbi:MAG: methanogenesis marker 12 protein [Methanoculleus sp.]